MAHKVGIIGCGPRGLRVLEDLLASQRESSEISSVTIWEPSEFVGAGVNYADDCDPTCLLNVPCRDLDIVGRAGTRRVSAFPGWREWKRDSTCCSDEDVFPPRVQLGRYLNERFLSLMDDANLAEKISVVRTRVNKCQLLDGRWWVCSDGQIVVDELHVCIGHQPSKPTNRQKAIREQIDTQYIESVYPIAELTARTELTSESAVAVQGFGLSCIDAIMALTEGRGGSFIGDTQNTPPQMRTSYRASGGEPAKIYPYTLDGLVPVPKPATAELDSHFAPKGGQGVTREGVLDALRQIQQGRSKSVLTGFVGRHAYEVAKRHPNFDANTADSKKFAAFLSSPREDPSIGAASKALRDYYEMACGIRPPSVGYIAGQVWRHMQRPLYEVTKELSGGNDKSLLPPVLEIDEGLKRLTYGPPAYQVAKMIALVEAGILSLEFLADPEVAMDCNRVKLSTRGKKVDCDYFINSVLSGVDPKSLDSPLLESLLSAEHIRADTELGFVSLRSNLQLHGRIHSNEVVGADSIHSAMSG